MTVVDINKHRPHLSGDMKCFSCGHQWVGISLIEDDGSMPCVECPKCKRYFGYYLYPVLPKEDEIIYKCNCGGELFYISEDGPVCIKCGVTHEDI